MSNMSNELIAASGLLADTLAEENAALATLDLPRAAAMLADKERAVAGFLSALNAARGAAPRGAMEPLARRLQSLSAENRTLLERAIAVQRRVIGVIAQAAAPSIAPPGYSAHGAPGHSAAGQGAAGHPARPVALALSARA